MRRFITYLPSVVPTEWESRPESGVAGFPPARTNRFICRVVY